MKTKLFVLTLFLLVPFCAKASVGFSEIMYDPPGTDTKHEWVEVYNSGPAAVDISKYKFNDGSSSTNHTLNVPPANGGTGSTTIPSGGYAIVADDAPTFLSDTPSFSGTVIDSTFTLLNSGATLTLLSCPTTTCTTVDTVSYTPDEGGGNDGTSLQKNSGGVWVSAPATPGGVYVPGSVAAQDPVATGADDSSDSSVSSDQSNGSTVSEDDSAGTATATDTSSDSTATASATASGNTSSGTAAPILKPSAPVPMKASITLPKSVTAGIPLLVAVKVTGYSGETLSRGLFKVAFGDGSDHVSSVSDPFLYTYAYPGTYVVKLQYWANAYSTAPPDVCVRLNLTVGAPSISALVNSDGSVTLLNSGSSEEDLSDWNLQSLSQVAVAPFVIPDGTILLPGRAITLASALTGSTLFQLPDLALYLPNGDVASVAAQARDVTPVAVVASADDQSAYPVRTAGTNTVPPAGPGVSVKKKPSAAAAVGGDGSQIPEIPAPVASSPDMTAQVADADSGRNAQELHSMVPFAVGLLGVIGGSVFAFRYFKVVSVIVDTPIDPAGSPSDPDDSSAQDIRIIGDDDDGFDI